MAHAGGGEAGGSDPDTGRRRATIRPDDHEFAAPATDIDDHEVRGRLPPVGHPEKREIALFRVAENVERDERRLLDVANGELRVLRPSQRLGGDERDRGGTEVPGDTGEPTERGAQLGPLHPAEPATLIDGGTEPDERRFVEDRLEPMASHDGDEEMDRVGAGVGGGRDHRGDATAGRREAGLREGLVTDITRRTIRSHRCLPGAPSGCAARSRFGRSCDGRRCDE